MVGIASAATHAYRPAGVPMIRNMNIRAGHIEVDDLLYLDPAYERTHRNKRLKSGDVVVVRTGNPGIAAVVPRTLEGAQCFTCLIIRPRNHILNPEYLCAYINSPAGQRQFSVGAAGGAQKNVNAATLSRMTVPTVPIVLQGSIVAVTRSLSRLSQQLQGIIDAKRLLKRGLRQQLLTGRKRFPEFVRSNETQAGHFGSVPRDWSVVQISDIAGEVKTRGEVDGAVVYSCTKHEGLVRSLEYFGKQVFSRNLDGYKRLQTWDFAYATNHIEEGSIGLLRKGEPPGLVSPMYTVFRPTARVNPEFLFALLKTVIPTSLHDSHERVRGSPWQSSLERVLPH
jgi:type I restriction enzyme S subunit